MKKTKKLYLVDLHTHLNEKKIKTKDWWSATKKKKLCAIAITEHSHYSPKTAYLKLKLTQPKNIILLPGLEAKTSAGDLLIYGTNEKIYNIKELQKIDVPIEKALRLVKQNNLIASFAHPYGYKSDSACEVIGETKTRKLIKKYGVGVEYYNGMLGSANELIFGRAILKKFYEALMFVEKNKLTRAFKMNMGTEKTRTRLEALALETLQRVRKGMVFAQEARYITVGSDAHYPRAIGSAIIQLKTKPRNEEDLIRIIKNKEIVWAGPNLYSREPVDIIGRKEMIEGLTYLTKKSVFKNKNNQRKTNIFRKIRLGKRIKTIKRITKKVRLNKIKQKLPRIRIKKRIIKKIPGRKIVKTIKKKLGLGK